LHLGKTGHFRKSGIAVPVNLYIDDLQQLSAQINYFKPKSIIYVGDLFHSIANLEHEAFIKWRKNFQFIEMHLVKGNHDILKTVDYAQMNLIVHEQSFSINEFCFIHDIVDREDDESKYIFSGHFHPGIQMKGSGKQFLKFSCFYFNEGFGILPAFGKFTGLAIVEPKPGDAIFAIVNQKVIKVHGNHSL
jgi:DNA ligase-associated metallophosphoesterase